MQRGILESARLHKILWLTEMDQHPECVPELGGDIRNTASTVATLRRNVLQPLCAGQGLWYYDHRVIPQFVNQQPKFANLGSIYKKIGWWESAPLIREVGKLQHIAERITKTDCKPLADVLLVYSTKSFFCRSVVADPEYEIHEAIARCGVSYACIYEEDLELIDPEQYRCVIFVNCFLQSEAERLSNKRLTANMTRVHLYADGFCNGKTLHEDNISETVGMKIKRSNRATVIHGTGLLNGTEIRIPDGLCSPFFAAEDPDAEILARYDNGDTAIAKKGNDIWLGVPSVNRDIMHRTLKLCNAHVWVDSGDPIIAGGGIVAINTAGGGNIKVFLKNGKCFAVDLPPYTTAVFDCKTGERLL